MSRNDQVANTNKNKDVGQGPSPSKRVEEHEYEANASAKAGLSLNVFSAFSGIFSGKSKKTTDTDADGKEHSKEHRQESGKYKKATDMSLKTQNEAQSSTKQRHKITEEYDQDGSGDESDDGRRVEGGERKKLEGAKK